MIKTENKELDFFWNLGLKPGGLILIAARPGMGKTSFLLSIGERISRNHKTQLISLENSVSRLKQNNISDLILIDDSPENNVELLTEIFSKNKPEVVLIDYIQLMNGDKEVKIFGEWYQVEVEVGEMRSMSAHGDYEDLCQFLACQNPELVKTLFLVHGEYEVQQDFAARLSKKHFKQIEIPAMHQMFPLP
jgi:predicted ATP-dependent serine protease